ncbi:MAG: acyltransferase domain-containing protein, partial [Acidobacteriota bacterium]|nr:acyltransferase domain-containing protein [Acidobacteriota bacterium]
MKSQIGHTKSAAGAAALFKAAMALHQKTLPPTIKVDRPNPKLDIADSPFYLNTTARPWIANASHPRRAAVSSFGFGGTNFHAVLEEYANPANPVASSMTAPEEFVPLSAATPELLAGKCLALAKQLTQGLDLRRAAHESQQTFEERAESRIAFVTGTAANLTERLTSAAVRLQNSAANWSDSSGTYYRRGGDPGKIAFLFAGQGSQYPDMGKDLAIYFPQARRVWETVDSVLASESPRFHETVFPLPAFSDEEKDAQARRLTATENAQPALAGAALAHLAILRDLRISPDFAAGHSFGEIAGLHCAGAVSAEDLVYIARQRGLLMRSAAAIPGAMTAVSHPVAELQALLESSPADVVIANYNSPGQTVLAGTVAAVETLEEQLKAAGIGFRRLPVSAAFHSPLLAGAAEPFALVLERISFAAPRIPVLSNIDAAPYPSDAAEIRRMLARHLISPVHFVRQIENLYASGVRTFVELGAGAILTGLVTACLGEREHLSVPLDRKGRHGVTSLWHALAQFAVAGVGMDTGSLWPAFAPLPERQTASVSASTFLIDGAVYAKPYPPTGGAAALPPPNPRPVAPPPPIPVMSSSPPPPTPPPPAYVPSAEPSLMMEIQRQIADAQKASHEAILESLSLTLKSFEALAGRTGVVTPALPAFSGVVQIPAQPLAQPLEPREMPASPRTTAPAVHVADQLLRIVSEKTGYPVEVLDLDADLESGLGIDSIKRVEIFSALQEEVPGLPELKPENMAELRTLAQIAAFLGATPPVATTPVATTINATGDLLRIVSEKTGYPVEVLDLDADLESGLGIDSIKRVEIFSALQEQVPGLPELKPENMAELRTLAQIAAFLGGASSLATSLASSPTASPVLE